ncbi:MAG: site-specific integrase [Verrucomicrobiaceae bacterium]|nr:site-specific integrase [Verrucomicrobiaceae bacterium]
MKADAPVKRWEKTSRQNLVRHISGRYYARLFLNGKEIWKSLKTDSFSVAQAKLAELRKGHKEAQAQVVEPSDSKLTFGQAAKLHLERIDKKVSIKKRTRQYWHERMDALFRSWKELSDTEIRKITPEACRTWAASFAKEVEPSSYNNTIAILRHVFVIGIEGGVIFANPAASVEKKPVRAKHLELPSLAKFNAFIKEMRSAHSRDTQNCADLTEGLAYTGCRIGEAANLTWADIDFMDGEIVVRGDPEEATKNGLIRLVPLIPTAKELFAHMREKRKNEPATEAVFKVRECQKAIDRAAARTGMARITHHDLRHLFATVCIESGVDIPTVSRWLGHKDGGALAMKTYGHLRNEHSLAAAKKVSFAA